MSDGRSNGGSIESVIDKWNSTGLAIPIFSITFGNSDDYELQDLAEFSNAIVFEGKENLEKAFKEAKGYN